MVHALREASQVLSPDGTLIDLRPRSTVFPIAAVGASGTTQIAEGDATATAADDVAANLAVSTAVDEGWLTPRHDSEFEIHSYWSSTTDMAEYLRTGRIPKRVTPSYAAIDAAFGTARSRDNSMRLRSTRTLTLRSFAIR